MKQKIIYFVHCFPPAIGGLELLSSEIVKILREGGYDVQIITGRGQTLDSYKTFNNWVDSTNDPQYIHRLSLNFFWQRIANKFLNKLIFVSGSFSPWYFGPILKYDKKVLKLIKEADLIIGAGMPTKMFYDAYRMAKKFDKKLISLPAYHNVNYYNNSCFFKKVLNYSKKIICSTPYELSKVSLNYQIQNNKLELLTYSQYSKTDWQVAGKRAILKEKEIKNKIRNSLTITIGFIGQITLRKNFQFFVKFIDQNLDNFKKQEIKVNFLFAGAQTSSSEAVISLFDKYKNLTNFIYDFSEEDKAKIFNKIDIFVNPSKEESLGLVNFDALYFGLPTFVLSSSAFDSLNIYDNLVKSSQLKKLDYLFSIITNNKKLVKQEINQNYTYKSFQKKLLKLIGITKY